MKSICLILLCLVTLNSRADSQHHQVSITAFEFKPKVLILVKGDRVTWTNRDIAKHNISLNQGGGPLSEDLALGEQFSMLVEEPIEYICGLHPPMTGRIMIEREK